MLNMMIKREEPNKFVWIGVLKQNRGYENLTEKLKSDLPSSVLSRANELFWTESAL